MAYATYPSLAGRTVLVTGGATGIGAALGEHFCAQGARVAFLDIDDDGAAALLARIAAPVHAPLFLHCDLTDIPALEEAIAQVQQRCGAVRALLNNAANDQRHTIEATTPAMWDAGMAVNLRHQFFAARAVAPAMAQAGGGAIVNFGSVSWMLKQGGMPAYTTAKAAVQGLTRSLARELGPKGIRVNTLVPGWVMTEKQLRLWVTEKSHEEIARGQCLPGTLLPEHIACMAAFLASDDSAMCTAQDFIVDGGWV